MKNYSISVKKVTDDSLMREACEMTFNGTSKQSLLSIYKSEHSPARTQLFWVTCKNIPLFISTHLLRHHVGSIPFQLTCRDDRDGGNPGLKAKIDAVIKEVTALHLSNNTEEEKQQKFEEIIGQLEWIKDNTDRYTPVNLGLLVNAQSLIDMAKLRLCNQSHKETIQIFNSIKAEIEKVDPALASVMVAKCVYRGGICGEPRCCSYNNTPAFQRELVKYLKNFSEKQAGIMCKTLKTNN